MRRIVTLAFTLLYQLTLAPDNSVAKCNMVLCLGEMPAHHHILIFYNGARGHIWTVHKFHAYFIDFEFGPRALFQR